MPIQQQQKKKKKVLIIENDSTRVDWLKDFIRPDANNIEITHDCVVMDFIEHFESDPENWDLVIFDCDLDPGLTDPKQFQDNYIFDDELGFFVQKSGGNYSLEFQDRDKNGHNGEDAATFLCDSIKNNKIKAISDKILTNTKIVIWSANDTGARNINKTLANLGFKNIVEIPYRMHKFGILLAAIKKFLFFEE